jgi:hypothetical protein
MYFFLPPFSTNCSSILSHLTLSSISWSTSPSYIFKIHIPLRNSKPCIFYLAVGGLAHHKNFNQKGQEFHSGFIIKLHF